MSETPETPAPENDIHGPLPDDEDTSADLADEIIRGAVRDMTSQVIGRINDLVPTASPRALPRLLISMTNVLGAMRTLLVKTGLDEEPEDEEEDDYPRRRGLRGRRGLGGLLHHDGPQENLIATMTDLGAQFQKNNRIQALTSAYLDARKARDEPLAQALRRQIVEAGVVLEGEGDPPIVGALTATPPGDAPAPMENDDA